MCKFLVPVLTILCFVTIFGGGAIYAVITVINTINKASTVDLAIPTYSVTKLPCQTEGAPGVHPDLCGGHGVCMRCVFHVSQCS